TAVPVVLTPLVAVAGWGGSSRARLAHLGHRTASRGRGDHPESDHVSGEPTSVDWFLRALAQAGLSGGQRHDRASGGSGHQPSHEKARHALVPPEGHRGGGLAHCSAKLRLDSTSAVTGFSLRQPWVLGRNLFLFPLKKGKC